MNNGGEDTTENRQPALCKNRVNMVSRKVIFIATQEQ